VTCSDDRAAQTALNAAVRTGDPALVMHAMTRGDARCLVEVVDHWPQGAPICPIAPLAAFQIDRLRRARLLVTSGKDDMGDLRFRPTPAGVKVRQAMASRA